METRGDNSNKPFISVIIPCYNVEEYIEECLDSIFAQTYTLFEVIVVDNNCTDNTIALVEHYQQKNQLKIKIIIEPNQGLSYARNAGLKVAKGEWVQFLDADDLLLPTKLEHQIQLIHKNVDMIASATIERDLDGREMIMKPHENVVYGLIAGYRNVGSSCSNLWRKGAIESLKGFDVDQKSSVEIDMMFRLYKHGYKFINDEHPLTVIRKRKAGQMSQGNHIELARNWLRLRTSQLKFLNNQLSSLLTQEQMKILFKDFLLRLHYQSELYLDLSHRQFHKYVWPSFKITFTSLRLRDQIKVSLYIGLGFKQTRKLVALFK